LNPISPENIHQHEMIGLNVEIITATNKNQIGLTGLIIDETKHLFMLDLAGNQPRRVKIAKKDCTFRISLPSGEKVDVNGQLLKYKPENRLKNIIRKRW